MTSDLHQKQYEPFLLYYKCVYPVRNVSIIDILQLGLFKRLTIFVFVFLPLVTSDLCHYGSVFKMTNLYTKYYSSPSLLSWNIVVTNFSCFNLRWPQTIIVFPKKRKGFLHKIQKIYKPSLKSFHRSWLDILVSRIFWLPSFTSNDLRWPLPVPDTTVIYWIFRSHGFFASWGIVFKVY